MAIKPSTSFPGRVDLSDPVGYPDGKAKDQTVPGNGTPFVAELVNDIFGAQQALLDEAGITASGSPDKVGASQYLDAIKAIAAAAGGAGGRLVKFLTSSGTLTINESADDTIAAYLTSNDIKSGTYFIYAYGAGGGGAGGTAAAGTGGGAGGGTDRAILVISGSTGYTIGAGGTGGATDNLGVAGGDTTISTVTGGGGAGGGTDTAVGALGGTGVFKGQDGDTGSNTEFGTNGGGPSAGAGGAENVIGRAGGLASGGGGGDGGASRTAGKEGGDGYIEIWEWS